MVTPNHCGYAVSIVFVAVFTHISIVNPSAVPTTNTRSPYDKPAPPDSGIRAGPATFRAALR
jgi:hypothetical protein